MDKELDSLDQRLVEVVPSFRQIKYQQLEFTGFIHFTVNTFTDREWGDGTESEAVFNPPDIDADSCVLSMKNAGMKGVILTCKHHDGFCLWPSKYTEHSVAKSPYKNGNGDVVREISDACHKYDMKFGIYLSPWDRNSKVYGTGKEYDDYFVNQLKKVLTEYGDIYAVWLDGACGEGENGKKQVYDFPRYYETIRKYAPNACISICGPDVRWCGNEAGDTRESEWSVVPYRTCETEYTAFRSQTDENDTSHLRKISSKDKDLGSRSILKDEQHLIWYPAEVDVSIRPGWFYHEDEDDKLKSLDELVEIYEKTVGGNAVLLLNVPINREGTFAKGDIIRLKELGNYIRNSFSPEKNLALLSELKAIDAPAKEGTDLKNILLQDDSFYMAPDGKRNVSFSLRWDKKENIKYIVLQENIEKSQRIEKFSILCDGPEGRRKLYHGTTVGYKKIVKLENVSTDNIIVDIEDSRVCPTLGFVGVYRN